MASPSFNPRSPSVKRIMQEVKEIQQIMRGTEDGTAQFAAEALESDVFEWHFAIRGPDGTDFEGGIYHGRILLPHDYPFRPPSFIMLTPSGRFETNTKICLSISSYHPDQWQPSWSMRTALTALIAFLPTPGDGAIGSMATAGPQRKQMAIESRKAAPRNGNTERQEVMDRLHALLLSTRVGAPAVAPPPEMHTAPTTPPPAAPVPPPPPEMEPCSPTEPVEANANAELGQARSYVAPGVDASPGMPAAESTPVASPQVGAEGSSETEETEDVFHTPYDDVASGSAGGEDRSPLLRRRGAAGSPADAGAVASEQWQPARDSTTPELAARARVAEQESGWVELAPGTQGAAAAGTGAAGATAADGAGPAVVRLETRATVMLGAAVTWLHGWRVGQAGWQQKWQAAVRALLLVEVSLLTITSVHIVYPLF